LPFLISTGIAWALDPLHRKRNETFRPKLKVGAAMKQVRLGRSGLQVSRIAFGTWQLGGDWGATDEVDAIAAIRRAADRGINFFDTARGYGFWAPERPPGKA